MTDAEGPGPIEAVFLGLDPAKHTSGAVILAPDYGNTLLGEKEHPFDGRFYFEEYGKVITQAERERFTQAAFDCAEELGLPLIVVAEEWDPPRVRKMRLPGPGSRFAIVMDPRWTYKTILGMGEGWGLWNAIFHISNETLAEDKLPALHIERVTPNDWRDDLWGPRRAKDSEGAKSQAQRFIETVFGVIVSGDIAEAGCIAMWGATSIAVREAVREWHVTMAKAEAEAAAKSKPNRKKKKQRR